MRRLATVAITALLTASLAHAQAVRGDKAMYVGGTVTVIPEMQQGKLDTSDEAELVFSWQGGRWAAPYRSLTKMEYGQKAGRRVGAAIVVSPLFLFSKKRKHYLTIHYNDGEGKGQAAVFELSKGTYRQIIASLEARTGLKTEYETDEVKGKES